MKTKIQLRILKGTTVKFIGQFSTYAEAYRFAGNFIDNREDTKLYEARLRRLE